MRASRCQRGDGTVIFERRGLRVVGFVLGFLFNGGKIVFYYGSMS